MIVLSRKGWDEEQIQAWRLFLLSERRDGRMRITFHVKKYTVTIIIAETHKKDRSEKNNRHLSKK